MSTNNVKLVVFTPISHAHIVRQALGESGAGKIGNYDYCSFSSKGFGRFRGNEHSSPAIGAAGKYEEVEEERIEVWRAPLLLDTLSMEFVILPTV